MVFKRITRRGSWIRAAWDEASPRMRGASKAMWVAGLAISVFGVIGDMQDWWANLQFVINLLSSLASALFGLPVALIYLQRANMGEAIHRRRQHVVGLARRAVEDVVDHVDAITRDPSMLDGLKTTTDSLRRAMTTMSTVGLDELEPSALLADWEDMRRLVYETFAEPVDGRAEVLAAVREWRQLEKLGPELAEYGHHWTSPSEVKVLALLDSLLERFGTLALTGSRLALVERAVDALARGVHDDDTINAIYDGLGEMEAYVEDVQEVAVVVLSLRQEAFSLQTAIQDADQPHKKNT